MDGLSGMIGFCDVIDAEGSLLVSVLVSLRGLLIEFLRSVLSCW